MTSLKKLYNCWLSILLLVFGFANAGGQDLNATVTINAEQIQLTDKTMFKELQSVISQFLNNRKWATEKVEQDERIPCTFTFIINKYDATSRVMSGSMVVSSSRAVYGSSYTTPMLNLNDESVEFKYDNFVVMDYQENQFTNSLSSLLSFYVFVILGLDYDSFGPDGGNPYFTKAQQIVTQSQSAPEAGWQAFNGKANRNRYWLSENLTNARYKAIHEIMYNYHRKGLDIMHRDLEGGKKEIYKCIDEFQKLFKLSQNLYFMTAFFGAKGDEIVNIFKDLPREERNKLSETLNTISNAYVAKWTTLAAGK
ncbi:MAG: DUF4835 family protein [Flavobacteriaceae bacterium]|nr:DUF4835 family protein [Flavobacteriaceae bacterium]